VTRHLSALLALCVCAGLPCPSAAQELRPLTVLVQPTRAGAQGPWSAMCEREIQGVLRHAGLEVMASPPPGEMERLAKAMGEAAGDPATADMAGADMAIRIEMVPEQAPGGAKGLKLRLEAIEQATGRTVGAVLRSSAPFGEGAGQASRAASEACQAGGAELVKQLQEYQAALARDGEPLRIEVRDPPAGLSQVLLLALKRTCTKSRLEVDGGRRVVASARCKGEQYEVARAVLEALEAKFPKGGCESVMMQRRFVWLACKP